MFGDEEEEGGLHRIEKKNGVSYICNFLQTRLNFLLLTFSISIKLFWVHVCTFIKYRRGFSLFFNKSVKKKLKCFFPWPNPFSLERETREKVETLFDHTNPPASRIDFSLSWTSDEQKTRRRRRRRPNQTAIELIDWLSNAKREKRKKEKKEITQEKNKIKSNQETDEPWERMKQEGYMGHFKILDFL
jgi:hypothetical protein